MSAISFQSGVPAPADEALVRVLATNDLLGTIMPLPATHGEGGSISGIVALLGRQRESIPTVWVDSGDLSIAGSRGAFGYETLLELPELPLSAAAAGNHDFDDGPEGLREFASRVPFPILCADRDIGLPPTAMIDTPRGAIGVVGITHPVTHRFSPAPPPDTLAPPLVAHADQLRRDGARWVLALLHDGATWWASPRGRWPEMRSVRLQESTRAWAKEFDAILGGHTLTAWAGQLHGTPAGHAHPWATSVLPVDLCAKPPYVRIHQPVLVPQITPPTATPATAFLQAAATRAIGELSVTWESRPGSQHYLPNLIAAALRATTGADAAFVPAGQLFTQAPIDGNVAALRAGTVSELDLLRLHPFDESIEILELERGEFQRLLARHDASSDPANLSGDAVWWNWARAPAGAASSSTEPTTVAVAEDNVPLPSLLLGRDLRTHRSASSSRQATRSWIARHGMAG